MKTTLSLLLLLLSTSFAKAQTRTITTAGSWSNTGIWSGGNIADLITENVAINNNAGIISVPADYTVGNIAMNNGNTVTINSGTTLNVGQSGTPKNLGSGNTATLNIIGTLIIWGDLNVGNNLDLNVSAGGILIIKGNVNMGNGGDLVISGSVQIDGNFVGGNDTDLIVNGSVTIGGNISVSNNSDISGSGTVVVGGTCTDGSSNFCGTGPLPIKLISFSARKLENAVSVDWVTSMEKDFDYFQLDRACPDLQFITLTKVSGEGGLDVTTAYNFVDTTPETGRNYYRLKSVDLDGTFAYSNVLLIEWPRHPKRVNIYPNPASGKSVAFNINFNPAEDDHVVLINNLGVELLRQAVKETENVLHGDLGPGVYVLTYLSRDFQTSTRVIIGD